MNDTAEQDLTPATQAVEVNLTAASVLVLEVPGPITNEVADKFRSHLCEILAKPGTQLLVLGDGITCKVLQRTDMQATP